MATRFRLDEVLAEKEVSQRELVRRSGVSYMTVHGMVHNRTVRVDLSTLDAVATALGVQPGDLLVYEPPKRRGK